MHLLAPAVGELHISRAEESVSIIIADSWFIIDFVYCLMLGRWHDDRCALHESGISVHFA